MDIIALDDIYLSRSETTTKPDSPSLLPGTLSSMKEVPTNIETLTPAGNRITLMLTSTEEDQLIATSTQPTATEPANSAQQQCSPHDFSPCSCFSCDGELSTDVYCYNVPMEDISEAFNRGNVTVADSINLFLF